MNLACSRAHINRPVIHDDEMECSHSDECETMKELLDLSHEAENTDDEEIDPSFELNSSVKSDTTHQIETFCEEWVTQLSRDDRIALDVFLQYYLLETIGKSEIEAVELAGLMTEGQTKPFMIGGHDFMKMMVRFQRVNKVSISILVSF